MDERHVIRHGHPAAMHRPPRLLDVEHRTSYRYDVPVAPQLAPVRLTPVVGASQRVLEHELRVEADGVRYRFEDVFGNIVTGFDVTTPYTELTVTSRSLVEVVELIDDPSLLPSVQRTPSPGCRGSAR
ncbi:MAG: transglutaminase N-terminal domain-containing protein [Ilumatobacteraceae bacterium]